MEDIVVVVLVMVVVSSLSFQKGGGPQVQHVGVTRGPSQ